MAGRRRQPVGREEARRLLATGLRAPLRPDVQPRIIDLSVPAPRPRQDAATTLSQGHRP
ncbi:hypothetical protein [Streptomyces sp. NPDC006610]|uniref:hypothetical protein n=1 Tax=Streptomyces sp. NPDC006610 TaxID=3154584 RepID=UPI0033ABBCD3